MSNYRRGCLILIKRNGSDGYVYFLEKERHIFGRDDGCDVRLLLAKVSPMHCALSFGIDDRAYLEPLGNSSSTYLNDVLISGRVPISHKDIITVDERSFRFEYISTSPHFPGTNDAHVTLLKIITPIRKCYNSVMNPIKGSPRVSARKSLLGHLDGYKDVKTPNAKIPQQQRLSSRRVTFGPKLTPEQFDKNSPVCTPIRRGSLPGRYRKSAVFSSLNSGGKKSPSQITKLHISAISSKKDNKSSPDKSDHSSISRVKVTKGDLDIISEKAIHTPVKCNIACEDVLFGDNKTPDGTMKKTSISKTSKSFTSSAKKGQSKRKTVVLSPKQTNSLIETLDKSMQCKFPITRREIIKTPILPKSLKSPSTPKNSQSNKSEKRKSLHHSMGKATKPLFSEVLKRGVHARASLTKDKKWKLDPKSKKIKKQSKQYVAFNPKLLALGSTGHVNSPETIIIRKKIISNLASKKTDEKKQTPLVVEKSAVRSTSRSSTKSISKTTASAARRSSKQSETTPNVFTNETTAITLPSKQNKTKADESSNSLNDNSELFSIFDDPIEKMSLEKLFEDRMSVSKSSPSSTSLNARSTRKSGSSSIQKELANVSKSFPNQIDLNLKLDEQFLALISPTVSHLKSSARTSKPPSPSYMKKSLTPLQKASTNSTEQGTPKSNAQSPKTTRRSLKIKPADKTTLKPTTTSLTPSKRFIKECTASVKTQFNSQSNVQSPTHNSLNSPTPSLKSQSKVQSSTHKSGSKVQSPTRSSVKKNPTPSDKSQSNVQSPIHKTESKVQSLTRSSPTERKSLSNVHSPNVTLSSPKVKSVTKSNYITSLRNLSPKSGSIVQSPKLTRGSPKNKPDSKRISLASLITHSPKSQSNVASPKAIQNRATDEQRNKSTPASSRKKSNINLRWSLSNTEVKLGSTPKKSILKELGKNATPTLVSKPKSSISPRLSNNKRILSSPQQKKAIVSIDQGSPKKILIVESLKSSKSISTSPNRRQSPKSSTSSPDLVHSIQMQKANETKQIKIHKSLKISFKAKVTKKSKTPKSGYSNVSGLKRLFGATSPKSDYTNVSGVKSLLSSKSSKSDYTKVSGVRKNLPRKSPKSDYTRVSGVKNLWRNKSPKSDYTNVSGVKHFLSKRSPKSDYTNVLGVKRLLHSRSPKSDYTDVAGVKDLFSIDLSNVADKFIERTFPSSSKRPKHEYNEKMTSVSKVSQKEGKGKKAALVKETVHNISVEKTPVLKSFRGRGKNSAQNENEHNVSVEKAPVLKILQKKESKKDVQDKENEHNVSVKNTPVLKILQKRGRGKDTEALQNENEQNISIKETPVLNKVRGKRTSSNEKAPVFKTFRGRGKKAAQIKNVHNVSVEKTPVLERLQKKGRGKKDVQDKENEHNVSVKKTPVLKIIQKRGRGKDTEAVQNENEHNISVKETPVLNRVRGKKNLSNEKTPVLKTLRGRGKKAAQIEDEHNVSVEKTPVLNILQKKGRVKKDIQNKENEHNVSVRKTPVLKIIQKRGRGKEAVQNENDHNISVGETPVLNRLRGKKTSSTENAHNVSVARTPVLKIRQQRGRGTKAAQNANKHNKSVEETPVLNRGGGKKALSEHNVSVEKSPVLKILQRRGRGKAAIENELNASAHTASAALKVSVKTTPILKIVQKRGGKRPAPDNEIEINSTEKLDKASAKSHKRVKGKSLKRNVNEDIILAKNTPTSKSPQKRRNKRDMIEENVTIEMRLASENRPKRGRIDKIEQTTDVKTPSTLKKLQKRGRGNKFAPVEDQNIAAKKVMKQARSRKIATSAQDEIIAKKVKNSKITEMKDKVVSIIQSIKSKKQSSLTPGKGKAKKVKSNENDVQHKENAVTITKSTSKVKTKGKAKSRQRSLAIKKVLSKKSPKVMVSDNNVVDNKNSKKKKTKASLKVDEKIVKKGRLVGEKIGNTSAPREETPKRITRARK